MKIAEINMYTNFSTGKIMLDIAKCARAEGHVVHTYTPKTYVRGQKKEYPSIDGHTYFGTTIEAMIHVYVGMATGLNGFLSYFSTKQLIRELEEFQPDIVHIHNIHAFCINYSLLFGYLKKNQIKTVWTLHDCWAFTGHCPAFVMVGCEKWKTGCHDCPHLNTYPRTYIDNTKYMWGYKQKLFSGLNMTLVTPSRWLADLVRQSFLSEYPVKVIPNGIDLFVFYPCESDFRMVYGVQDKKIVLGVAAGWGKRKGYNDCLKLAKSLEEDYVMVLVGVSKEQKEALPKNIIGIERTNSQKELAEIYSSADVFINTTYDDNYPTVNLEARACGLPIVTYRTGGSPESAGKDAILVDTGDVIGMKEAIKNAISRKTNNGHIDTSISREHNFKEYVDLYKSLTKNAGGGY